MSSKPTPNCGFVLSAGRTGTVWLAHTLDHHYPAVKCVHEPSPARLELMLGNLCNRWGGEIDRGLRWLFLSARRKRLGRLDAQQSYIEINPMLCPITGLLGELGVPFSIVHQVRDPRTWTASILNFKASGFRRHLVDWLPFATPYPYPRPPAWRQLDPVARALWRWRFCNEQILAIRALCQRYTLIRYEALFSDDEMIRQDAISRMLDTLQLSADRFPWLAVEQRLNVAPSNSSSNVWPDEPQVTSICGDLLSQFGYDKPMVSV